MSFDQKGQTLMVAMPMAMRQPQGDAAQSQFNHIDAEVTDHPPSSVWNYCNTFLYLSEKVSSEQLLSPPTLL